MKNLIKFEGFPKIPRLSRQVIITEKIDGTCGVILITDDDEFYVGSRTRWITPEDDNHGFARWAYDHKDELITLGHGRHFGEWWGQGIQRGYGLKEKRFSLFNVKRWGDDLVRPTCCYVVPVLREGMFDTNFIKYTLDALAMGGSVAAPGFMHPEGIIIYHAQGNLLFKKTIEKDDGPKSRSNTLQKTPC